MDRSQCGTGLGGAKCEVRPDTRTGGRRETVGVGSSRDLRSGCDLLIDGGRLLDLDADSGVLDDTAIAVRVEVIVAVGPRAEVEAAWTPPRSSRVLAARGRPYRGREWNRQRARL